MLRQIIRRNGVPELARNTPSASGGAINYLYLGRIGPTGPHIKAKYVSASLMSLLSAKQSQCQAP